MRLAFVTVFAALTARLAGVAEAFAAGLLRIPLVFLLTFVFQMSALAQTRVDGRWQVALLWTLDLSADGTTLSGTFIPQRGEPIAIYDGRIDGRTVTFKADAFGDRTVIFTGTVNGNEILFTRVVQLRAGTDPGGRGIFDPAGPSEIRAYRGIPALTEAVWLGDVARVRRLLAAGEDPAALDTQGYAPWRWAIIADENEALARLLEKIPVIRHDDVRGQEGLLAAAARNNLFATRELIRRGVPVDVPAGDGSGATSLFVAAASGYTDLVTLLLKAGADVKRQDAHGDTALMAAVRIGSLDTVKLLLAQGADVGQKDTGGRTALLWAARSGRLDVTRALLQAGAQIDVADATARTPLAHAAEKGYGDIVDLLRAQGAQGEARSVSAVTARAAVEKSLPLLQRGAATWIERRGCPACHHALMIPRVTALARLHGFPVNDPLIEAQFQNLRDIERSAMPRLQAWLRAEPRIGVLENSLSTSGRGSFMEAWTESAWLDAGAPRDATREASALRLARLQLDDGRWRPGPPRVPIESSEFTTTASAARVLVAYGPPDQAAEMGERIVRARRWLESHTPTTTDDKVFRLLGLHWTGSDGALVRQAADVLRREQNPDGGWAQLRGMNSDAYATGLALVALHQAAATPVTDTAYTRGVKYLLTTQEADGSWLVHKRAAPSNDGYFESGFPHGKFQFISYAGTCWATMALIYASPSNRP